MILGLALSLSIGSALAWDCPSPRLGRILRGSQPADFIKLSPKKDRRIVFVLAPEGIETLRHHTDYEKLIQIGYTREEIRGWLEAGIQFKLATFDAPKSVGPATWDQLHELVAQEYNSIEPEMVRLMGEVLPTLKSLSYGEVQAQGGPAWRVRKFLEDTLHLNPLYSGDGSVHTLEGTKGPAEYLIPNLDLSALDNVEVQDLHPQLPIP